MKKRLKKLTAVLLTVTLVLSIFTIVPFSAEAAETDAASVAAGDMVTVYFINAYQWQDVYVYTWEPELSSWPGQRMTYVREEAGTGADIYKATINKNSEGVVFSNGSST